MSTSKYELFDLEHDLRAISKTGAGSSNWMTSANAASAEGLAAMVHEARVAHQPGVVTRFHEGEVRGHSAPAHLVLRATNELNDAIVTVANSLSPVPAKKIDDSIRNKYGMLLRPVMAGSIQVDLVCPDPDDKLLEDDSPEIDGQTVLHEFDETVQTLTKLALDRVLHVLKSVHEAQSHSKLEENVSDFPPAAWAKLVKLASRCTDGDFTIDFFDRAEQDLRLREAKSFSFTPANAAFLKSYVEGRSLSHDYASYRGEWLTASRVRNVFDLETSDGLRISGTVPDELISEAGQFFGSEVEILVLESSADDLHRRRKLVEIAAIEPQHRETDSL